MKKYLVTTSVKGKKSFTITDEIEAISAKQAKQIIARQSMPAMSGKSAKSMGVSFSARAI